MVHIFVAAALAACIFAPSVSHAFAAHDIGRTPSTDGAMVYQLCSLWSHTCCLMKVVDGSGNCTVEEGNTAYEWSLFMQQPGFCLSPPGAPANAAQVSYASYMASTCVGWSDSSFSSGMAYMGASKLTLNEDIRFNITLQ